MRFFLRGKVFVFRFFFVFERGRRRVFDGVGYDVWNVVLVFVTLSIWIDFSRVWFLVFVLVGYFINIFRDLKFV